MLLRLALIFLSFANAPAPHAIMRAGQQLQQDEPRPPRVAVLDFGQTAEGRRAADTLTGALAKDKSLKLVDRELSRAAAIGAGYTNSLNLTLDEARDIGAAIDCDFFIIGDAQTLRRSPSVAAPFYEAYASVFIVSARTGELVAWTRAKKEASQSADAEKLLLEELNRDAYDHRVRILRRREDEQARRRRLSESTHEDNIFEDAPEDGSSAAANFRPPQPFRRLHPPYPATAAEAETEATLDAQVEINANGEVARVSIVRWGGFGLDESVADTIRQMHFRPATRDGAPVPVRVLLRYNFRRPAENN